ncbi:glutathione S-transferase [Sphingomonas sp. BE123]|uniref:glutathione S-transferase n=1 Tax=Sphingomonas sp. BE123 TaxID=2817842 RepID=UPI00285C2439|nr:glutathione S-transferase [Sphingomonas sp. BE123]MDR6851322.1 glutathione S-transferase [Sphingomonas sp. BE123]
MSARCSRQRPGDASLTDPILYSFRRCPYAIRARLALAVSETAVEHREVRLRDKPAEMIAASPKGTVPVLVLPDGRVIDESLDIMRWALARNDPEHWLAGDAPALIAANDGAFKHHLDRYKYPERYPADGVDHRAAALAILQGLGTRLGAQAWLGGARFGLADAAILPFVRQFAAVDPDWFAAQDLARVQPWLAAFLASPLFAAVMVTRTPWRAAG